MTLLPLRRCPHMPWKLYFGIAKVKNMFSYMILYRSISENSDYISSFEMDIDDLFMISEKHFFGGRYIKNKFRTKQKCINNKLKNAYTCTNMFCQLWCHTGRPQVVGGADGFCWPTNSQRLRGVPPIWNEKHQNHYQRGCFCDIACGHLMLLFFALHQQNFESENRKPPTVPHP